MNPHKSTTLLAPTKKSASRILEYLMTMTDAKSFIDVGCGQGEWLAILESEYSPERLVGIDGEWIDQNNLAFKRGLYIESDLAAIETYNNLDSKTIGNFDLAISLEVGEHLPESTAKTYVAFLTSLAPAVLFSAAVPLQGGMNHINEQWPEYWRSLFADNGYMCLDVIRPFIWTDEEILPHYRQNIFLYYSADYRDKDRFLTQYHKLHDSNALSLSKIHPSNWHLWHSQWSTQEQTQISGKQALHIVMKTLLRRLGIN